MKEKNKKFNILVWDSYKPIGKSEVIYPKKIKTIKAKDKIEALRKAKKLGAFEIYKRVFVIEEKEHQDKRLTKKLR